MNMFNKINVGVQQRMFTTNPILRIDSHPFFIGPISLENDIDVPSYLPFFLDVHPKYAIPALILTDEIRKALSDAYSHGSMLSTPLGESALSEDRMFEMMDNLLRLFDGDVKNLNFLEIGCGTGALLNELKKRGANVMGVEIGPQGQDGANKFGFQVVDKPFVHGLITEKFDCIFSYGCLEHMFNLEEFFLASRDCLKEHGLFFHSVPNSEFHFKLGSLGHLAHEHVYYFTRQNGVLLFDSQGFRAAQACTSNAGNELFIWGYYDKFATPAWPGERTEVILEESEKLKKYSNKLVSTTNRIVTALKNMQSNNQSVGFYAGGFEYSRWLKDIDKIRYFDGDPYKHGKTWLQGLPCIESPQVLEKWPIDNLIICKDHYFEAIVQYLVEDINIPNNIKIHKLGDLAL